MPLYEFACNHCEHTFEALLFGEEKAECPECHGEDLKRLISLPGAPQVSGATSSGCGDPSLPPCGAPWCQRQGK